VLFRSKDDGPPVLRFFALGETRRKMAESVLAGNGHSEHPREVKGHGVVLHQVVLLTVQWFFPARISATGSGRRN
jgi:hypothetical protein